MRHLAGLSVALVAVLVVVLAVDTGRSPLRVVDTQPADGAVLDAPPREVSVSLSGVRQPEELHLSAAHAGRRAPVSTSPGSLQGQRLVVPVSIQEAGDYLLAYHVRLADGQQVSGVSRFTVARPGKPVAAVAGRQPATAADHDHAGDDPLSGAFLLVDLVLVLVVAVVLVRRPRLRTTATAPDRR
jgi:methionine-rich copper-binding protein CopC